METKGHNNMDHMILDQRLDDLPTSVGQYKHDGIEVTPESCQKS